MPPGRSDAPAPSAAASQAGRYDTAAARALTRLAPPAQEDACAICLDAMTVGENVRMLGCGHRFHQPCLRKWLHGKGECVCPMCRVRSQPAGKARAQA